MPSLAGRLLLGRRRDGLFRLTLAPPPAGPPPCRAAVATAAARRAAPPGAPRNRRNPRASRPEAPAIRLQFAGFLFAYGVFCLYTGSYIMAGCYFCNLVLWLAVIPR